MNIRRFVLLAVVGAMGIAVSTQANAQVRIEAGVLFNVPPPHRSEIIMEPPFPDAVWIPGHWVVDDYSGRQFWMRGHWIARDPESYYDRGPRYRHVPHGVAKGWWKNHGREYNEREYRDQDRERSHDRHDDERDDD